MRRVWSTVAALVVCFLACAEASAQELVASPPLPVMKTVTPELAKVGQSVTITGKNLGKRVAAIYLTDGKQDWQLTLVEQTETKIVAKIPGGIPNRQLRLMARTPDNPSVLVEQPLLIEVILVPAGD